MRQKINRGWKFALTDVKNPDFDKVDEYKCREVRLPHDWSCDYPVYEESPADGSGGYARCGIGWYRKEIDVPVLNTDEEAVLYFEGVYMNSDVYMDGVRIGGHIYGYTPFEVPVTAGIHEILVVVDNSLQPGSRWYSGSGITRSVWLETRNKTSIDRYGIYTTNHVYGLEDNSATLRAQINTEIEINTELSNIASTKLVIKYQISNPDGETIYECSENITESNRESDNKLKIWVQSDIEKPKLWEPETPSLYSISIMLYKNDVLVDERKLSTGLREIAFDPNHGFVLNGRSVKMNGVCLHHDGGCVGAAVPIQVWQRRFAKLKDMGCNAIRTSHNPPDEAFLDLCDQMGFLVMDEAFDEWKYMKSKDSGANTHESHGYSNYFEKCGAEDAKLMVLRDRNHPSIVIWSIGNEVPDQTSEDGAQTARMLKEICHKYDPTRLITQACDQIVAEPRPAREDFLNELEVVGYNYVSRWRKRAETMYEEDHAAHPDWCLIGTENTGAGMLRGNYSLDYDKEDVFWGRPYYSAPVRVGKLLKYTMTHEFVAGDFMWTGVDYLGEAQWPNRLQTCGCLDTCGFEKDAFYFYKSVWNTKEAFVHLCPHWNLDVEPGTIIPMLCYTSCSEAELFVNGKSYGRKAKCFPDYGMTEIYGHFDGVRIMPSTDDAFLSWDVPYEPGKVEVVGYVQGVEACRYEIKTSGDAKFMKITSDKKLLNIGGEDYAQIEVRLFDETGAFAQTAENLVHVEISGAGEIVGVDSGNPADHSAWAETDRHTFCGLLYILVRSLDEAGDINISVSGEGLETAQISLSAK